MKRYRPALCGGLAGLLAVVVIAHMDSGAATIAASRPSAPPYLSMPHRSDGLIPPLLSQTGAFRDVRRLEPAGSLIPYEIIVSFWSDGAVKRRWISVPDGQRIH